MCVLPWLKLCIHGSLWLWHPWSKKVSFIVVTHGWAAFDIYKIGICLHWSIPSNVQSVIDERLSSFSHFKMEKSDSTDVVFGKAVASPPQNWRNQLKGTSIFQIARASLPLVWDLYVLTLTAIMLWPSWCVWKYKNVPRSQKIHAVAWHALPAALLPPQT